MDKGQMKNIVVLRDIPSNIVDEAIVILKNNTKIKKTEKVENRNSSKIGEETNKNYDFIIKEAENVINEYIKKLEKPKETKSTVNKIIIKYRKLQIYSFILGITAIIAIIVNIIK